ncbi:MAG TPA: hypothetical protein ENJ56_04970 [Anaerolineae bacterium]|nr:hypothetical protein [Anaerolineae bacterium]
MGVAIDDGMIIDFHNHFFPKAYLEAISAETTRASTTTDAQGNLLIVTDGDYSIIVEEHHNPAARVAAMDAAGCDMQVLTITVPSVHSEKSAEGIRLAQIVNDGLADACAQFPNRFCALAALPLQNPAASVIELERTVTQANLRGGLLFSHINGDNLDNPKFWPLYEKACELDVPLFIHPIIPAHIGALRDYRLVALEGFLFDTSLALSRLIYSGVLERFPQLQLVAAHLGGTLPFLSERMDRGFAVYPECRQHISQPPSTYLRRIFMDTFPHSQQATQFAIDFAGADKILMGSDYPHQIGDLAGGISTITDLAISDTDKALILGGNANRLLKL